MKTLLALLFFLVLGNANAQSLCGFATTNDAYICTTDGSDIVIRGKPYELIGTDVYGQTEVFRGGKLLYSFEHYFSKYSGGDLFTGKDGEYLVAIHFTGDHDLSSDKWKSKEPIDYGQPAIEIYKHGNLYKTYCIRDVIDTLKLWHIGQIYDWGYSDTSHTSVYAQKIGRAAFVMNNIIYIINDAGVVITLDLGKDAERKDIPLDYLLKNMPGYKLPKVETIGDSTFGHPPLSYVPVLTSGERVDKALAHYIGIKQSKNKGYSYNLFFDMFLINNSGLCEEIEVRDLDGRTLSESLVYNIKEWLMMQHYETNYIPKGIPKYNMRWSLKLR